VSYPFILCLVIFLGLAALRVPVAFAMYAGAIFYLLASGQDLGLVAGQSLNGLFDGFVLLSVPLFIIAASFMSAGTVTDRLLGFCQALVGRFRGGLGHVNVIANIIFAGMSGSAIADAAGIGKVIIDMMRKNGRFPDGYAAAITAAASVIGPIIPPSIPMVLYALVSDTSIGYLFLGGVMPGLLLGLLLMLYNYYAATKRNFPRDEIVPLAEIPSRTWYAIPPLLLPVILLGGIYGGATTPTEAAAVAALYALVLAAVAYRAMDWKTYRALVLDAGRGTAVVGVIIASALLFNYIVASENIPRLVAASLKGLDVAPLTFLLGVNVLFLLLGCLFDATTLLLIVIPLFLPAARELGVDLVHFGVVMVVNIMIGLITPPYGVLLFVISGICKIPLRAIIREIWPFIAVEVTGLVVMAAFPSIVLWLPRLLGYKG
jgi:tripartite ATP-independent transporter DctM subunit